MSDLLQKIYSVFNPVSLKPGQQELYVNLDDVRGSVGIVEGMARAFGEQTGHEHPLIQQAIANYTRLLQAMGLTEAEIASRIAEITGPTPQGGKT